MATMRELKERINSVHSSRKITGAMKMIASARLRKAENKLNQAQPYQKKLWEIYTHTEKADCDYQSPLTEKRNIKQLALIVFASDDGLCGAFNINLYKKLQEIILNYQSSGIQQITVFPVGKKIKTDVAKIPGIRLEEPPFSFEEEKQTKATTMLADSMIKRFLNHDFDRVEVIYTHYKSMGVQINSARQFLPVVIKKEIKQLRTEPWYIFEPDCKNILQMLYPLILHADMYEMLMQNRTSEQAARILAMQMANDNATKLLNQLQLEYNKLRQQEITTELLDIAGGSNRQE